MGSATEYTLRQILDSLETQVDTVTIYNVTVADADTEYSQSLPANTRRFLIKCRTSYELKVCYTSGESGTKYITVPAGLAYCESGINVASLTLYFQCATAGQVAEIVAWS